MIDPDRLKKMSKDEIIESCSNIAYWGFNDYDSWEQQSAVYGLLDLYRNQQKEIEELQIIADDIKGHNIVYTDTPEFEEKFISKDKIRETIEDLEEQIKKKKKRNKKEWCVFEENEIKVLEELLEEN